MFMSAKDRFISAKVKCMNAKVSWMIDSGNIYIKNRVVSGKIPA